MNLSNSITPLDGYFDLKGLEAYSSIKVPTLRDHIRYGDLPCFKVKGKILIKKSEFDRWIEQYRLNKIQLKYIKERRQLKDWYVIKLIREQIGCQYPTPQMIILKRELILFQREIREVKKELKNGINRAGN